jgi:hypothetical protein
MGWPGYINRPDLTAQKFIPRPFGSTPGERLYKPGPARWLADGNLPSAWDLDFQVKIVAIDRTRRLGCPGSASVVQEVLVAAHTNPTGNSISYYLTAGRIIRRVNLFRFAEFLSRNFPITCCQPYLSCCKISLTKRQD